MKTISLAAAALALCGGIGAARAAESEVWSRVPALPTGVYQQDGFAQKVEAAGEKAESDRLRQEKINNELSAKVRDLDPMELASRQQQYMMDHPQEAMAMMQRNAQLGETFANDGVANAEERLRLDQELDEIDARYKTALDRALAPVKARFADLDVRANKDPLRTEAGNFYKPWAVKEWNGIAAEENAVYERVGAEWWGAAGPYHGWLKRLRAYHAKVIPGGEEAENLGAGFMVQAVGTPTAGFKPVSSLRAVYDYLAAAGKVFARRRAEPVRPMQ